MLALVAWHGRPHRSGAPCVTVSIPDNRKDQPTVWYELTFWGADATFARQHFRNGTVLTASCGVKVKNDRLRLNVRNFTPCTTGANPKTTNPDPTAPAGVFRCVGREPSS